MKPRYVVINQKMRKEFEMEWELPYGYASTNIFMDFDKAIDFINNTVPERVLSNFIIEKCWNGDRERVY